MEPAILGIVLDSSVIIEAERKRQTVADLLRTVRQAFGEVEVSISAITVAELAHGIARATTPEIHDRRRAFLNELKKHVPVHSIGDKTGEIAGKLGGEQASKGITLPTDDLLIGASAVEQGYSVATLNIRHFEKIPGLLVIRK